jgi:Ca2+-binding RTX toxin-like protein
MARIAATSGPDRMEGTDEDDILAGLDGDDDIYPRGGNDAISPGQRNDWVHLGGDGGRDIIEIEPDGGHDLITGFRAGEDTLVFNGFSTLTSFAALEPFITSNQEDASLTVDVSAAAGGVPGTQTFVMRETFGFGAEDVQFGVGVIPIDTTGATLIGPVDREGVPDDPGRFELVEDDGEPADVLDDSVELEGIPRFEDPDWG